MGGAQPVRSRAVLALAVLVATAAVHGSESIDAAAKIAAEEDTAAVRLGSRECPLDISVLWTADVFSPVYSTPVILPSYIEGRKQVLYCSV